MNNLFAYGTLMCEDIFYSVAGMKLSYSAGLLKGYCRYPVIGHVYPGILPRCGFTVQGIVYSDVPDRVRLRLDRFEGEMYERCSVLVKCEDNKKITAYTYIIRPQFAHCLEQKDWNFQNFLVVEKKIFRQSYAGYTDIDETE